MCGLMERSWASSAGIWRPGADKLAENRLACVSRLAASPMTEDGGLCQGMSRLVKDQTWARPTSGDGSHGVQGKSCPSLSLSLALSPPLCLSLEQLLYLSSYMCCVWNLLVSHSMIWPSDHTIKSEKKEKQRHATVFVFCPLRGVCACVCLFVCVCVCVCV